MGFWKGAALLAVGALATKKLTEPEVQDKLRQLGKDLRADIRAGAQWVIDQANEADRSAAKAERARRAAAPTETPPQPTTQQPKARRSSPKSKVRPSGRRKTAGATA